MEEIVQLIYKIDDNALTSADVSSFVLVLREGSQKGVKGFEKVSKDDIQWFETYAFALKKYEFSESGDAYDIKVGDWRNALHDVGKLKFLVDELGAKKLVKNTAWYVDGIALFDIPDPARYRLAIYKKIREGLEKIS